jgi:hypothetical protein
MFAPTSGLWVLLGGSLAAGCTAADPAEPAGDGGGAGTGSAAGTSTVGGGGASPGNTAGSASGGTAAGQPGAGAGPVGGSSAGGSGGVPGGGSGSGGAGGPCGTGSIFCSDFEAAAIPEKMVFFPEYLRAGQKLITLDTAVFHGGKQALKVDGSGSSQMLAVTVPSKFWGRVYLRSDNDSQEAHVTYVNAGTGNGDPNDGTYIRIGEHSCQLELNRNTDDKELLSNGGQYMCQGGVKVLKDTWYCLEFYFDGPGQETRVFVDGTEVTALHTTDWGTYDYKLFKLGYENYGGTARTIWYDDLALATEQVHCL